MDTHRLLVSEETEQKHIALAERQGDAYDAALKEMIENKAAQGASATIDDYIISFMVEEAKGHFLRKNGAYHWQEPRNSNAHLEIAVQDAYTKRFVPGLGVSITLEIDSTVHLDMKIPFIWHPWLYHYGRNLNMKKSGFYQLKVMIEPPKYGRHDLVNGDLCTAPVSATFSGVALPLGKKMMH